MKYTPKRNLCALIDKEMKSMDVGFADHSIVLTHRGDQQNPFSLVEMRFLLGIALEVLEVSFCFSRTYIFPNMLSLIIWSVSKILSDIRVSNKIA